MSGRQRAEAVIFDLDGTLSDSLRDIADAMNRVLASHRLPCHPLADYRRFVGQGVRALVERAVAGAPEADVDGIESQLIADYRQHLLVTTAAYPGIDAALAVLAQRRLPLAVLSNKLQPLTERIVAALFGHQRFACVRGQRPGVPRKPDPTSALAIAGELGVAAERCAFVGDTAIDVHTARAAAMRSVGVTWGFRDRAELEQAGAAVIISHPAELPTALGLT